MEGNLIDLAEQGHFNAIVHGCNCFHTMGSGIAKEIKDRYPPAYAVDIGQTIKGDKRKLGGFTYTIVQGPAPLYWRFTIINAYTQYRYGKDGPHVNYDAVCSVFKGIQKNFPVHYSIGYPKIGAGLAGGNWDIIQAIINKELTKRNHHLVTLK